MSKERFVVTLPYEDEFNDLFTACVLAERDTSPGNAHDNAVDAALKVWRADNAPDAEWTLEEVAAQFTLDCASVVNVDTIEYLGDWDDPKSTETH